METPSRLLRRLFETAVAAAQPAMCLPPHLPPPPKGRTVVVGFGKAAAAMAEAVEAHWPGPVSGVVVTRYGYARPCRHIRVIEAAHPVPDGASLAAADAILAAVAGLSPEDLVLCLVSGGGSALMAKPAPGIDLALKQALTRALIASGAPIAEINTVRKRLSAVKGGRLALACRPAKVVNLVISDVPGDDPANVASGPSVEDRSPPGAALAILERYGIAVSPVVRRYLQEAAPGSSQSFDHVETRTIASAKTALEAAAAAARAAGLAPILLGDAIEGEARAVAQTHAALALEISTRETPLVLLSGGETSVTLTGAEPPGRGGRNAEYLLALALALNGAPGIHAIACDTDGIDGSEDNAGARLTPDTLARAEAAGLDPAEYLARHDTYGFFERLGDLVVTGPTFTNVNDFRAILVAPPAPRPIPRAAGRY